MAIPVGERSDSVAVGRRILVVMAVVALVGVGAVSGLRIMGARRVVRPADAERVERPDPSLGASVSHHGDDFGVVEPSDPQVFVVCDVEADGNPVRGEVEYFVEDPEPVFLTVTVDEFDGAGGTCTRITVPELLTRHRVCERNHLVWVCGNWTAAI